MTPRRGLALALLAVLLTFAPTIGFEFVSWDDGIHVLRNPAVQSGGAASARDVWLTPGLGYPTPLPVATYRVEHALVGNAPWLFHATNVVVHLVVCALVFALGRRIGLSASAATLATLLFGMHPVVAESVSWVSGRKDLLVTAITLATLLACLLEARPTWRTRTAAWLGFVLALACKPVAVFLVPVIPTFRTLVLRRPLREGLGLVLPMLAPLAIYLPIAVAGQRALGAVQRPLGVAEQARSIWYALGVHSQLLLFAREPSAKYMPPSLTPPFDPGVDLAPLVLVAILGLVAWRLSPERRRAFGAVIVFAVVAYAPNSNLIPLARYIADTYVYLPLVGIALALALGFDQLLDSLGERARFYAVATPLLATVFLAMLAVPASARYHDSLALWEQARRANPDEWRICRNWSNAVLERHGPEVGLRAIDTCARRFGPRGLHKNRGRALVRLRRVPEALTEFELAARERPEDEALKRLIAEMRGAGVVPTDVGEDDAP